MTEIGLALLVFACSFSGALIGMQMRSSLPEHHLDEASKNVVHLCMGLIATITALILGLVTASAKTVFDEQDAAVRAASASVVSLDRMLARYGPETKPIRAGLQRALATAVDHLWKGRHAQELPASDADRTLLVEQIEQGILDLSPLSDSQRWLQSQGSASRAKC